MDKPIFVKIDDYKDVLDVITQAEDRPRQLRLPLTVSAVLPESGVSGRAVLARIDVLDLVEAFYDAYALPDHGITQGRPLSSRQAEFEGLRVYAANLEALAPLQNRIETTFDVRTEARTAENGHHRSRWQPPRNQRPPR